MDTRAEEIHEQCKRFKKLESSKNFAIKKALRKFHSIPLEVEDFECIAWESFLETERKYKYNEHKKTYENFYRDCLYWRAKDYCLKYTTHKHMACNLAESYDYDLDYKLLDVKSDEKKMISKLTIEEYIVTNKNNEKGQAARLYMEDLSIKDICIEAAMSKSKLYRVIEDIKKDLQHLHD